MPLRDSRIDSWLTHVSNTKLWCSHSRQCGSVSRCAPPSGVWMCCGVSHSRPAAAVRLPPHHSPDRCSAAKHTFHNITYSQRNIWRICRSSGDCFISVQTLSQMFSKMKNKYELSLPLRNKNIWEYTAKYNVIYYIIHFHILETSAYILQYTPIYKHWPCMAIYWYKYLEMKTEIALHVIFIKCYPLLCTYIAHTCFI